MKKLTWVMLIALVICLVNDLADITPIIPANAMLWFDLISIIALFFAFGFKPIIMIGLLEPLLLVFPNNPFAMLAIIPWYTLVFAILYFHFKVPFISSMNQKV